MLKYVRFLLLTSIAILPTATIIAAPTAPVTTQTEPTKTGTGADNQISKEDISKASEAFGHFIGRNLKSPALQFDIEGIIKGIRDGASGKPAPMADKDYEKLMAKIQEHALQVMSKDNLAAAKEFLIKNAKESGVIIVQPEKLQYKVLKEGHGEVVGAQSSPKINYSGKFIDGTVFGTSEEAGGPVTIPLSQTIQGFSLGIAGMKEGEQRRLFVHPDLGYGTSGHLPPNSLLIFDIEVVKANDKDAHNDDSDGDDDDEDDDDLDITPSQSNKNGSVPAGQKK
jgi:peptidylprolyl isomerase